MVSLTVAERVPNSPFLNESWYVVFGTGGSTFTAAFASVASVVAPIMATGASYAAIYPAGSVATGTYSIYGYIVKGSTGTHTVGPTIKIRNSEIADPAKTIYDILRNNVGSSYSSTLFSTGWYSDNARYPQVTVTRTSRTDMTGSLFDVFRDHEDTIYVDTWVSKRAFGAGQKNAWTLLDDEVKRIINANRKAPSAKLRHMQITRSQDLSEIEDNRKVFRTRHSVRTRWDETLS